MVTQSGAYPCHLLITSLSEEYILETDGIVTNINDINNSPQMFYVNIVFPVVLLLCHIGSSTAKDY